LPGNCDVGTWLGVWQLKPVPITIKTNAAVILKTAVADV
jgi:hypothetical protein